MLGWRFLRAGAVLAVISGLVYLSLYADIEYRRATLLLTAIIAGVTIVYALITYEILVMNERTAGAAKASASAMEQSLRFSNTANLVFLTQSTKDPLFTEKPEVVVLRNEDYERALEEHQKGVGEKEYVFAMLENIGRGPATTLEFEVTYKVNESQNPNNTYELKRKGRAPVLGAGKTLAVVVYVSQSPDPQDHVALEAAEYKASDLYRDALSEPRVTKSVKPSGHTVEKGAHCVIALS